MNCRELDVFIENNMHIMISLKHGAKIRTEQDGQYMVYKAKRAFYATYFIRYNANNICIAYNEDVLCIEYNANNAYKKDMHKMYCI